VQVQLVQPTQQIQVLAALRAGLVIVAGPRQAQQFALPFDGQLGMIALDPLPSFLN
jgi:hypothetical protein